ncbi:MAG: multiheme c-type cytochrome [Isosphaeraceae bacterium]
MARFEQAKAPVVLASLAVCALLITIAVVFGLATGARFFHEPAALTPTRAGNASEDGRAAGDRRAQALFSSGRFDEAFSAYRGVDAGRLQADDWLALGMALLDRDRIVLGWAALEAAHRIDPGNSTCSQAIDKLQARLVLAQGRERLALHEAASRVDLLSAVRGGPPLGMLVLGLAGSASDRAQEQEFLDRLVIRERSVLATVGSVAEAVKLVARLLLEVGQPIKAQELLKPLILPIASGSPTVNHRGGLSPTNGPDREAAWLLSRAALQLDQDDAADAMLALAGDFGQAPLNSPEPAPFVGSKRCGDCHRFLYRQEQRASRHAQTLRLGADLRDVPLPSRAVADPHFPGLSHSFMRTGTDHIEIKSRIADRAIGAIIEYAVGSGRHGITMIAKDEQGIDRELRLSYFGEGRTWGETKGITAAPREPGDQVGLALAPKPLRTCLHCHSTWFGAVDISRSAPKGPEALDRGIGCERCHGPGLNHKKAVESGFAQVAIALSARSPALARLKSCTECHASDGSIEPSDPEFTRAQGTTLLFSRCFIGSGGQLGCTTCHEPHRVLDNTISHYETKCLECHPSMSSSTAKSPTQPSSMADRSTGSGGPSCPVNPASNCVSCHMPKVETADRRSRFTDHHIRVHHDSVPAKAEKPHP